MYNGRYLYRSGDGKEGCKPDQKTCIITILAWAAAYEQPDIIQSDQGTHFTGKVTK